MPSMDELFDRLNQIVIAKAVAKLFITVLDLKYAVRQSKLTAETAKL